jgi:hypothetical protein
MAIVVLKGLLGANEESSVIGDIDVFRKISAASKVLRYELEPNDSFDSALLGHQELFLDQGPLTVAALGVNPPERSLHFHVSLLSTFDDSISSVLVQPTEVESDAIAKALARLSTKNLTLIVDERLDHALISERLMEIRTIRPTDAKANGLEFSLPIGEGDIELRRFIDDSINILADEEFNARRIDLGVLPINLAWPWGQGERPRVPNRALALGFPWQIRANSFALRGLARLSGFRPEKLPKTFRETLSLVAQDEAKEKAASDVADQFLEPLFQWQVHAKAGLCVVATGDGEGLAAFFVKLNEQDSFPFDERSLTERRVEKFNLVNLMDLA